MDFTEMGIYGFYKPGLNLRSHVFKRGPENYISWSEIGQGLERRVALPHQRAEYSPNPKPGL